MEEKLKFWEKKYNLKNLVITGYRAGYPIIQFEREENMPVLYMSEREKSRIIRTAETYGGIELGVGYNLRKTAFILINDETIVICGHEFILERILEKIF